MLKPGNMAPLFSLSGDDGQIHDMKAYRGNPLVLFFYPKDLTPGCTMEACDFATLHEEFRKRSVALLGISKDSLASHARFKSKHSLTFPLLSDPDLKVHQKYFAYGEKSSYGKVTTGVIRSTFLIDPDGVITKSWYKVRVKNHAQVVFETLLK